jgi:hypothetical protein
MIKKITFIVCCFVSSYSEAQIVFKEDFNGLNYLNNWTLSAKVEQAVWLGKDNSNYLRFHPKFQNQFIVTPNINLLQGNYRLFFDWNKAGEQTVDSVTVQLTKNNGTNWQTIYAIYNGNNRNWQTDSIQLNNMNGNIKIRWNYFTSGSFPSQYFNIDNLVIENNIATSIKNKNNDLQAIAFPNPSDGRIQIKLINIKNTDGTIFIYNTQGNLVYQNNLPTATQSLVQIDLSSFSKGSYILNLKTAEQTYLTTIIIQ